MQIDFVQPGEAQQAWMKLGYGLFIHFGPNTFAGAAWGDGRFPAANRRKEYLEHKDDGHNLRSAVEPTVRSVKHPFPVGKLSV